MSADPGVTTSTDAPAPERPPEPPTVPVAAFSEQIASLSAQLEAVGAALRQREDELRHREAACAEQAARLAQREHALEGQERRQIEQTAELQQLAATAAEREQELARREETVRGLQAAISQMSDALKDEIAPPPTASAASTPSAQPEVAAAENSYAAPALASSPAPPTVAEPNQPAKPAHDQSAEEPPGVDPHHTADKREPAAESAPVAAATATESPPARVVAGDRDLTANADPASLEARLDPETAQKLRVLRRLTGGRVPDAELVTRIRGETAGTAASRTSPGRGKRKSWG